MLYNKDIFLKQSHYKKCHSMLMYRRYLYADHVNQALADDGIPNEDFDCVLYDIQTRNLRYELIEVEENNYIDKFVIRVQFNDEEDMCIVFGNSYDIINKEPYLFIRTIFLNSHDDQHATLDESKYYKPLDNEKKK